MKNKKVFWLIVIFTTVRLLFAAFLELGRDEAYYYTYALHLQPNYIDHPPGVAYLIKLFSLNLLLRDELFIRLGAVFSAAAGTFLCFKIGEILKNERTGFYAAVMYNTSIYTSVIAGIFILPDSPYVVFWLSALLIMCRMCKDIVNEVRISMRRWLLFGLLSGLCMLCKLDGAFLWLGLFLFIMIAKWKYLFHPGFFLALFICLIVISPLVAWSINSNFVSLTYYSSLFSSGISISGFVNMIWGQLVFNNPVNSFIIIAALIACFRRKIHSDLSILLLLCTGVPLILLTTGLSLIVNVQPHWSGPGFLTLSFLGARWLDGSVSSAGVFIPRLLKYAFVVVFLVMTSGALVVKLFPGTMGSVSPLSFGRDDLTLDVWGWRKFNHQFAVYREREKLKENALPDIIVSNKWFSAAHLEYYIAMPLRMQLTGIGKVADLQHFAWLNQYRPHLRKGSNALAIVPSNNTRDITEECSGYFKSIRFLNTFSIERNGEPARYFCLYILEDYQQNDEAHLGMHHPETIAYEEQQ